MIDRTRYPSKPDEFSRAVKDERQKMAARTSFFRQQAEPILLTAYLRIMNYE